MWLSEGHIMRRTDSTWFYFLFFSFLLNFTFFSGFRFGRLHLSWTTWFWMTSSMCLDATACWSLAAAPASRVYVHILWKFASAQFLFVCLFFIYLFTCACDVICFWISSLAFVDFLLKVCVLIVCMYARMCLFCACICETIWWTCTYNFPFMWADFMHQAWRKAYRYELSNKTPLNRGTVSI